MARVETTLRYKSWKRSGPVTKSGVNALRGKAAWDLVLKDIGDLREAQEDALDAHVSGTAISIAADMQRQLLGPDRPHRQTGDLARDVKTDRPGRGRATVYVTKFYAPFLEFGTRRHRPYPFFLPNVRRHASAFLDGAKKILASIPDK